ncbi:MAG: hypothetical protein ACRCZS_25985 [Chroococcidiopsis sp.]
MTSQGSDEYEGVAIAKITVDIILVGQGQAVPGTPPRSRETEFESKVRISGSWLWLLGI